MGKKNAKSQMSFKLSLAGEMSVMHTELSYRQKDHFLSAVLVFSWQFATSDYL